MFACNVLLLFSLVIVAAGLWRQVRTGVRHRPCTFFWGVLFLALFVALPLSSNLIYGPALVPQAWKRAWITADRAYLVYGLGVLAFAVGYLLATIPFSRIAAVEAPASLRLRGVRACPRRASQDRISLVVLGVLIVLGFAVFLYGTGLPVMDLLRGGRFVHYERGTLNLPLVNLGQKMVGLIVVYAYLDAKQGFPRKILSVAVYFVVLAFVVLTGGRKWIVFVVSGMVPGVYDRRGGLVLDLRGVAAIVLAGAIVLGWQVVRYMNLLEPGILAAMVGRLSERLPLLLWEGDATFFYRASLEGIRANLEQGLTYPFAVVRRIAFLPFPNEWTFGLKPQGIPLMFAEELQHYTEARRGNLPPGLLGIFTLSFDWWGGLILGPVLTLPAVRLVDSFVRNRTGWLRDVLFANFVMVAVLLMRGTEGGVYFLAFNLVVVGCINWFLSNASKLREAPGAEGL